MELWHYQGEPTIEEIIQLEPYYKDNHLAIRHSCPNCGHTNTAWIRKEWSVCFDCLVAFTLQDVLGYYDVQEYNSDPREEVEYNG